MKFLITLTGFLQTVMESISFWHDCRPQRACSRRIDGGRSPLQHARTVSWTTRFSAVCIMVLMDPCPGTRLSMKKCDVLYLCNQKCMRNTFLLLNEFNSFFNQIKPSECYIFFRRTSLSSALLHGLHPWLQTCDLRFLAIHMRSSIQQYLLQKKKIRKRNTLCVV